MSDEQSTVLNTHEADERARAVDAAASTVRAGNLVVLPTDTVYGIGADAFDPSAIRALLEAKGRGRDMPPPVLVHLPAQLDALATEVPDWARSLVEQFWPGPLTVVCRQQRSLTWDLGETRGTVAIRMPNHPVALEIIEQTGPMAVSSANLSGRDAAENIEDARAMLGDSVQVYVNAGATPGPVPSTIVDCTGPAPRVLRLGGVSVAELNVVLARHELELTEDGQELVTEPSVSESDVAETADSQDIDSREIDAQNAAAESAPTADDSEGRAVASTDDLRDA